jgi:major membrane immunogen (membrane-anchored lipoprotein)
MEVQANDFVDWTPVLKSLENACSYSKSLQNIENGLLKLDEKKNSFELIKCKKGSYKGIDAKYQRVMRPAFVNVSGEYKNFRIPLVNSKLYGLK